MAYHCPCGGNAASPCGEQCDDLTKRARPPVFATWILMRISDNSFMGDLNLPLKINKLPDGAGYEVTCPYYATEAWSAPKEQDAIRAAKAGLETLASNRAVTSRPAWMDKWQAGTPGKADDAVSLEATESVPVPLGEG